MTSRDSINDVIVNDFIETPIEESQAWNRSVGVFMWILLRHNVMQPGNCIIESEIFVGILDEFGSFFSLFPCFLPLSYRCFSILYGNRVLYYEKSLCGLVLLFALLCPYNLSHRNMSWNLFMFWFSSKQLNHMEIVFS